MRVEKIKVDRKSLGQLVQNIEQGQYRIPRFQREFVWERKLVITLLDSMHKEYPIGTIFLWNAPSEYNHLLRDIEDLKQPPLSKKERYTLILDGQQRLTSLYAVMKGLEIDNEDYRKIVVDLANDNADRPSFQYRTPDNQRWVSVSDLMSADNVFEIYNQLPNDAYKEQFTSLREALNNYPFSVVIVSDMEIDDAIEIFERINRQGRRLTRYDLISASVLSDDFDLRERTKTDIVDVFEASFGEIEETSITQALALNIRGRTEHATQLSLTSQEVQDAWGSTVESFKVAVDFARKNLGVSRQDFLPYDAVLPVLSHYFYKVQSKSIRSTEHRKQIEYWFWRVAFSERYSGASQTRMTEDANWIRRLIDSDEPYNDQMRLANEKSLIESSMSRSTSAVRNGVLCMLSLRKPRHFKNGGEIGLYGEHFSTFTKAERHHIFPVAFLRNEGFDTADVHNIPNFCFIPADLNKEIADSPPNVYMNEIKNSYDDYYEFAKVMATHLIPIDDDSGIWTNDYELFLHQRAKLLSDEIKHLAGVIAQVEPEHKNSVVDAIEVALRDVIHHTLLTRGYDYWKECIPGDIQKNVSDHIDRHVSRTPGVTKQQFDDPREKLNFCDVSDYSKIITSRSNWQLFGGIFKNKDDCQRYLNDLREYRNAVKHNRQIDPQLHHRAHAAIIWLRDALDIDLIDFGI